MILSELVETSLHQKTIKYYKNLGYHGKLYDKIMVKVLELPINSRVRISVKCDKCNNENYIIYNNYNRQINKYNYYCCHSCSQEKNKITNLKKFGTEFSFQSEEVKIKIRKSLKDRYGYEHALQNPDFFTKAVSNASKSSYLYEKYLSKNLSKQIACIDNGYNFLFIIDKDYTELEKIINENE